VRGKTKGFIKTRVKDSIKPSDLVFRAGGRRVRDGWRDGWMGGRRVRARVSIGFEESKTL
jgi:hypothetical protein